MGVKLAALAYFIGTRFPGFLFRAGFFFAASRLD
jgi:hypothetical protein